MSKAATSQLSLEAKKQQDNRVKRKTKVGDKETAESTSDVGQCKPLRQPTDKIVFNKQQKNQLPSFQTTNHLASVRPTNQLPSFQSTSQHVSVRPANQLASIEPTNQQHSFQPTNHLGSIQQTNQLFCNQQQTNQPSFNQQQTTQPSFNQQQTNQPNCNQQLMNQLQTNYQQIDYHHMNQLQMNKHQAMQQMNELQQNPIFLIGSFQGHMGAFSAGFSSLMPKFNALKPHWDAFQPSLNAFLEHWNKFTKNVNQNVDPKIFDLKLPDVEPFCISDEFLIDSLSKRTFNNSFGLQQCVVLKDEYSVFIGKLSI